MPNSTATKTQGNVLNLSAASDGAAARASGEDVTARIIPARPRSKSVRPPVVIAPVAVARTRPRARNTGRPKAKAGARSSSSSGDDPDEAEPARRRLCAYCNQAIDRASQARYCSQKHADRDRQRRKRARSRELVAPRVTTPPDERRYYTFEPGEDRMLLLYALCRCNGNHILERDPELGHRCVKCGRQRPESPMGRQTLDRLAGVLA